MDFTELLLQVCNPWQLLALFLATGAGVIVGAIPGLTVTLALSLILGFLNIISLDYGLAIMAGIYVGGIYGGSITAILCNIPGTGSSLATLQSGYPMTQKGLGIYVVHLTRIASVIGTFFGCLALLLFTPLLIEFSSRASSAVIFSLCVFGLSVCICACGKGIFLKSLICALFGILLSQIGMDDLEGTERFTFNISSLYSGIELVPFLIGLYAIPEVLKSYAEKTVFLIPEKIDNKETPNPFLRILRHLKTVLTSSFIGIGLGVLPGVGEDIAAWTAYGIAKKKPTGTEDFGHEEKCVIAPEVANNAAIGGALVPVLSLGIPGSAPAAIFLGALLLYGISPGPMLTIDRPDLLPRMVLIFFLADIMLLCSASLLIKPIIFLLKIPARYLMPCIIVIAAAGSFSIGNSLWNVGVMGLTGMFAFFLMLAGFPRAPIALGLILGNLMDVKLRTTLISSNGSFYPFIYDPFCAILLFISVALFLWRILKN